MEEEKIIRILTEQSRGLKSGRDLDSLIQSINGARIVVLGGADQGTHEFYQWRAKVSQRLVLEKGFNFIAMEADWDDCFPLNRYIRQDAGAGSSAAEVLQEQQRWPAWPLANWEIVAIAEWLTDVNKSYQRKNPLGFFGLDRYGQWGSMEVIREFIRTKFPHEPSKVQEALSGFEICRPGEEEEPNELLQSEELIHLLTENRKKKTEAFSELETTLGVQQQTMVAFQAEKYYRFLLRGGAQGWNLRNEHMMNNLNQLLTLYGEDSKGIVWAHNNYVGDTRATGMRMKNLRSLGELIRIQYGKERVRLIGMGSYHGSTVMAAEWGAPPSIIDTQPAQPSTWEALLHVSGSFNKWLLTKDISLEDFHNSEFQQKNNCSVVGLQGKPYTYLNGIIPYQYDAFFYFDQSKPIYPLHVTSDGLQFPEDYPFGV